MSDNDKIRDDQFGYNLELAQAYMDTIITLAEVNHLTFLEMMDACRWVVVASLLQMAKNAAAAGYGDEEIKKMLLDTDDMEKWATMVKDKYAVARENPAKTPENSD